MYACVGLHLLFKTYVNRCFWLTHFMRLVFFCTPWNIRSYLVFWCFQGVEKGISSMKWVDCLWIRFSWWKADVCKSIIIVMVNRLQLHILASKFTRNQYESPHSSLFFGTSNTEFKQCWIILTLVLTHFSRTFLFNNHGKYKKTFDFPEFLGSIKWEYWPQMG